MARMNYQATVKKWLDAAKSCEHELAMRLGITDKQLRGRVRRGNTRSLRVCHVNAMIHEICELYVKEHGDFNPVEMIYVELRIAAGYPVWDQAA